MEYECGPLLLYSQDKIRMMDFLSDVFEFDVDSISDSVQRGPLFLKLCEQKPEIENFNNKGIVFSFKVKSENELREIMNKYNFFLYRKAHGPYALEKIGFEQTESKKMLTISDIDQRLWRFELETRPEL
jgi:hypothetical protein